MTQQLYFDDPLCLEFQVEVTEVFTNKDGKIGLILPGTYFYPTSGGQDHDTGKIGDARVLDVYKGFENNIIHVLDREILPGIYPACIDSDRRMQNMQSHTAQHLLSRVFELELNLETLSANINFENPSTIDLDTERLQESDFDHVERVANSLIFENRQVRSYYIQDFEIPKIPFRRPPKVSGTIRVIEVDGFDYSACGGTHCLYTGMVGLIKIIKFELQNRKIRVHFVAGNQAYNLFRSIYHTSKKASGILETSISDLADSVQRQLENINKLRFELEDYKNKFLSFEVSQLTGSARMIEKLKIISKIYPDKSQEELRKMVSMLRTESGLVIVLAGVSTNKLSIVVGCSQDVHLDARKILNLHLEKYNGHGGGDHHLAQGGCKLENEFMGELFDELIIIIKNLLTDRVSDS